MFSTAACGGSVFDQIAVDSWLTIHADNTASLKMGKVEMGQGTPTALLMIAAEELDMKFSQMKPVFHDTNVTPNQGASVGSQGVQTGGKQTRAAAAAAKSALLDLAAANLGVAKSSLTVKDGVVGSGRSVTYGDLIGDKLFNVRITGFSAAGSATAPAQAVAGSPGTKPVSQYALIGTNPPRIDIPEKVTGKDDLRPQHPRPRHGARPRLCLASAILNENDPSKVDRSLDPFDTKNGYNSKGASHYTPEFQKRYFEAQSARMNQIIDRALALREKMKSGEHYYKDNDIVVIARGGNSAGGPGGVASLHVLDPSIESIMATSRPQKLIKNDGSIATEIIRSVAVADPGTRETNISFDTGTKVYSVVSFLSNNAVRSTNSLDGIDHCTSNNSTVCAVQSITVPELYLARAPPTSFATPK